MRVGTVPGHLSWCRIRAPHALTWSCVTGVRHTVLSKPQVMRTSREEPLEIAVGAVEWLPIPALFLARNEAVHHTAIPL